MKDILIVAHFSSVVSGNGRFDYLASMLATENVQVELLTSSFSHTDKKQRAVTEQVINSVDYQITLIHEPNYSKNISLKRIYSHYKFGKNLKKYLESRKKPDVIYCAVPSLSVAKVVTDYTQNNNIELIIDIQDLWPEAFKMVFDVPIISTFLYSPMKKSADYIYSTADQIVGVSNTYVERALSVSSHTSGLSVYLGTDLNRFDQYVAENPIENKSQNEIWVTYIGTLGSSYDLYTVIDSLQIIEKQGIENIKLIVMGSGPLESSFKKYAKDNNINVDFLGRLSYEKMVRILSASDIALNPIRKGSAASIINKVGDYAAAGLPVINTQESEEYQGLLVKYNSGINIENNNPERMAEKILLLANNRELRKEMGVNNRQLAEDKFDRNNTYKKIKQMILDYLD